EGRDRAATHPPDVGEGDVSHELRETPERNPNIFREVRIHWEPMNVETNPWIALGEEHWHGGQLARPGRQNMHHDRELVVSPESGDLAVFHGAERDEAESGREVHGLERRPKGQQVAYRAHWRRKVCSHRRQIVVALREVDRAVPTDRELFEWHV